MIDADLLDILACPACRAEVRLDGGYIVCAAPACGLRYPVRAGIPILLVDEAEKPPARPSPPETTPHTAGA